MSNHNWANDLTRIYIRCFALVFLLLLPVAYLFWRGGTEELDATGAAFAALVSVLGTLVVAGVLSAPIAGVWYLVHRDSYNDER